LNPDHGLWNRRSPWSVSENPGPAHPTRTVGRISAARSATAPNNESVAFNASGLNTKGIAPSSRIRNKKKNNRIPVRQNAGRLTAITV
jgi:hypothetical protein